MAGLTNTEMQLWHAWKQATDTVRTRVAEDITRATGLSDPDFGVLTRLAEGGGRLRQNELATSMNWHRSRLSHHLTRMAQRDLVHREEIGGRVDVLITEQGRDLVGQARPVHADAVRAHLLRAIPRAQQDQLCRLLAALGE
ncbi:MAG TPA: MarR family transcriptional regulator [Pseudonocardiaceae bacterium]|nr:MarR family transcriptional regulator [Pseudonocardiaceae bacterium]